MDNLQDVVKRAAGLEGVWKVLEPRDCPWLPSCYRQSLVDVFDFSCWGENWEMCKKHVSGGHLEHLRWSQRYLLVAGSRHSESLTPLRGAGAAAGAVGDTPGCETWKVAATGASGDTPGCEMWNRCVKISFSSSNSFSEKIPSSRSDFASLNTFTYFGSIGATGAHHKLHEDNATVTVCFEGYNFNLQVQRHPSDVWSSFWN